MQILETVGLTWVEQQDQGDQGESLDQPDRRSVAILGEKDV